MNLSKEKKTATITKYKIPDNDWPYLSIYVTLDTEISIAERTVKDAVTLFGDIGGISGFFLTILGLLVGSIPSKLFALESASSLFKVNLHGKSSQMTSKLAWFNATKSPKLKFTTKLKILFCNSLLSCIGECVKRKKEQKLEKLLEVGSNEVQNMLDLREIVKLHRASETLQRLILSKPARKMIGM